MIQARTLITLLLTLFLSTSYAQTDTAPQHTTPRKKNMVVSSQHYATRVGLGILHKGGNAIDAAVAVGYALAVVHPCCGNIGGGGFMLIHTAKGHTTSIDFRETAPAAITNADFVAMKQQTRSTGYLPVGIPGTVMGLNTALDKYGTLPLSTVMQPAIDLANNGYKLNAQDIRFLSMNTATFKKQPNIASIFLNHGKAYQLGDTLKQPQLAKTLTLIAKQGSPAFYTGPIAKAIVQANETHHGLITAKDLADYRIHITKPLTCTYRGYKILTVPPPSSGIIVCEILGILNNAPLSTWGYGDPRSIHATIEAMRYGFHDRNTYLGDPRFVQIPTQKLLSPQRAKQLWEHIPENQAQPSADLPRIQVNEKGDTTHFVVADQDGNVVSLTYTLNGLFGAKVIPGDTGFFLNDELDDFALQANTPNQFQLIQSSANTPAPGKRPLSSMSPVIVMKDNQPILALGAAGGPTIISSILEGIINIIDYKMTIHEAIKAPRFHMQWLPDMVFVEPFTFPDSTLTILKKMGYHLIVGSPFHSTIWGQMAILKRDPTHNTYEGANDPRRPGGLAAGESPSSSISHSSHAHTQAEPHQQTVQQ